MSSCHRKQLLSGISIIALAFCSGSATAQEVALDGLIIEGEKIERSYQETTTSVGVATSEDIQNYSIYTINESFSRMANVRYFSNNGGNNSLQIRGINADGFGEIANAVPLISVIIDGATQNREGIRRGSRGSWDLKQVEVLRGPQSGLYGRAALAGAVVIESNDPTYHWESAFRASGGSFEHKSGGIMLSGPLVENQVAFRISAEGLDAEKDISYQDSGNSPLGEDQYRNVRGKLLIEPKAISGLSALFTFSRTYDQPASSSVSGPNFFKREYNEASLFTEFREAEVNNFVADVSYAFTDAFKLRSVSAYIDTDLEIGSAPASEVFFRDDLRKGSDFTQDIRLEINDKNRSGLSGVVGFFYGDFSEHNRSDIQVDPFYYLTNGAVTGGFLIPFQQGTFENETQTTALYADLRQRVFGPWSLIGGLRWQRDKVSNAADNTELIGADTTDPFNPIPIYNQDVYDVDETFNVWLPKFGLAFDIDENQSISATARRGYRQGFSENLFMSTVINSVDPEFVWTYELAYRLVSPDKRLSFGATAFYNRYTDQQFTFMNPDNPPFTNTFNAGRSESYGAELEGKYDFGNGLQVFGALGLLKTEIKELTTNILTDVCPASTCVGNEFPEAPTVTFSFGGIYKHRTGFFVAADASFTGDYYSTGELDNRAAFEVDSYFLANAKIGYEFENLTASVFAKNIFDKDYVTGYSSVGTSPMEASIGDGRVIGVEILGKF